MEPFSYEADIAPATTNFLRSVRTNTALEPEVRRRLANDFFGDVSKIRNFRAQMGEILDAEYLRPVKREMAMIGLQRARQQVEQEEQEIADTTQIGDEISRLFDDQQATPEEKYAAMSRMEMESTARSPRASYLTRMFAPAKQALRMQMGLQPEPLTNAQVLDAMEQGVPRSLIESGDINAVGEAMNKLRLTREQEALRKTEEKEIETDNEKAAQRRGIAQRAVRELDLFTDPDTLAEDASRFKNPATVARIKQALALSPDPALREIGKKETNASKLRDAYLKDAELVEGAAAPAPRYVLPPRR